MTDRSSHWGTPKKRSPDPHDSLEIVRGRYPDAHMEGSAGLGRVYCVFDPKTKNRKYVADCWSSGRRNKNGELIWWLRIAPEPMEF